MQTINIYIFNTSRQNTVGMLSNKNELIHDYLYITGFPD